MKPRTDVPAVTAEQMRQADRLADGKYHLDLLQMMENAGRGLARLARDEYLGRAINGARIVVLVGPGGNGGGGLAAARRLQNWGAEVEAALSHMSQELAPVTRHQQRAARAAGVKVEAQWSPSSDPDLILDAFLGYSVEGAPRPPMDDELRWANAASSPVLSLDLPSGLDPDSGAAAAPTARADATVTLGLPKYGLLAPEAGKYVGALWLADISLPPALFEDLGMDLPADLFQEDDLIRIAT